MRMANLALARHLGAVWRAFLKVVSLKHFSLEPGQAVSAIWFDEFMEHPAGDRKTGAGSQAKRRRSEAGLPRGRLRRADHVTVRVSAGLHSVLSMV
jgi:hypothetical protein